MLNVIYVVWGLAVVLGFYQGFFKQVANLLGIVAGIILATIFYSEFGQKVAELTGSTEEVGGWIAFILISVIVPVALGLLASLLTKLFKKMHLGFVNRLAGAVLALVIYTILMGFAFNVMDFINSSAGFHREKLKERPELYYQIKQGTQRFIPDAIIVSDSLEEARAIADGDTTSVHHGLADKFRNILGGEND